MAVDLSDLTEMLSSRVSPPGTNLYPNATDDDWLLSLQNAFWDLRINGMLAGFVENAAVRGGPEAFGEGVITPRGAEEGYDSPSGWNDDEDLAREYQQLIILWGAWRVTLAKMLDIKTAFKAKAGPVEFEKQQAATVLKAVLDSLKAEIDDIKGKLSSLSNSTVAVFDAVIERTYSQWNDDSWWVR